MPPKPVGPATSKLAEKLKKSSTLGKKFEPLWKGPEDSSDQGGITQSLLSKFIVCHERFRVRVIEGLAAHDQFNKNLEYGNMWHVCEESLAANPKGGWHSGSPHIAALDAYVKTLHAKYKFSQEEIWKWQQVCKLQFPIYCEYWKKHPDVLQRTPLMQEYAFKVPYELPSGRIVYLRGKFDSVDLIGKGKDAAIFLQENKTKSELDVEMLKRQLTFDLQTMMYLVALREYQNGPDCDCGSIANHEVYCSRIAWKTALSEPLGKMLGKGIAGVRYNCIRRPLSSGRGSIKRHEARGSKPEETWDHFFGRLHNDYLAKEPQEYFERFKVDVLDSHYEAFEKTFLQPCLEQLCDWYLEAKARFGGGGKLILPNWDYTSYRTPFGIYNPLLEQGFTDVDEYLATGNSVGLTRTPLFQELTI